jgi:betaine-aldehyde dehydrogenase
MTEDERAGLIECPLAIGGAFRAGRRDQWFESLNPATEEPLGRVALADADDVDDAVQAAAAAQKQWMDLPDIERAARLHDLAAELIRRTPEIIDLEARDTGNTAARLGIDIEIATNSLRYHAGILHALKGDTPRSTPTNLHLTLREPYGVVARIVPFNHPFMFAAARIAPGLAAGNAVIVKTPEQSPLSSRLLAEACHATLVPGLVNIVHGPGAPTGAALVAHPQVKRIGFTGSIETGRLIQRSAAESSVKHITLELGGKNPMIIFPDISPMRAAAIAVQGMNFASAGQSCGATTRVLVHDSIYDEVVALIAGRIDALVVGNPLSAGVDMGPMNSRQQLDKALHYINVAKADGARLVAGGSRPLGAGYERGYWIRPTAFADVTPDMRIAQEEVFGPVLAIMRWRSEDEALAIANSIDVGLATSIWTDRLDAALQMARRVVSGYVWINGTSAHFVGMPFSGRRQSGVGSEESMEELLSFTETKSINILLGQGLNH